MALEVAAIALWLANHAVLISRPGTRDDFVPHVFLVPGYATVGAVIAARQRNRIGVARTGCGRRVGPYHRRGRASVDLRRVDHALGSVIGPLVVWLTRRDRDPFIDQAGREALNFGISIALYGAVVLVTALMLVGIPLLIVGVVAWVVLASLAAVKASEGQAYRYPLTMRLVR
jgi:hypothetical protein